MISRFGNTEEAGEPAEKVSLVWGPDGQVGVDSGVRRAAAVSGPGDFPAELHRIVVWNFAVKGNRETER